MYKNNIIENISRNNLDIAKNILDEYKKVNKYDMDIYILESMILMQNGQYEKAKEILLEIYYKYELNFDINYTLGVVYKNLKKYEKATWYFLICLSLNKSEEQMISQELHQMKKFITSEQFIKLNNDIKNKSGFYFRNFPVKNDDSTYIGENIKGSNNQNHIVGIYDNYCEERDDLKLDIHSKMHMHLLKHEILKANKTNEWEFETNCKSVIPIMVLNDKTKVKMKIGQDEYILKELLPYRYYYYPLDQSTKVYISSNEEFVLGKIIELKSDDKKPKLVLNIFIDGLSQQYIEEHSLEKIAPNVHKFFSKGTIMNNCHAAGDWTYTSIANMYSGLYTANHRIYHDVYDSKNMYKHKLFTEILNENGFFNCNIGGDWRTLPSQGYIKGIDRFLYQYYARGMHCEDVIMETIEHLEAFKNKNNFLWITLSDLHDIPDQFEPKLSGQFFGDIESRIEKEACSISVEANHSKGKVKNYGIQLKRMDTYLGLLFNYIKENYNEDEILISLVSDHGQNFLYNTNDFLDEQRTKVPMMFRGKNIKKQVCNEFISTLDLFPSILKLLKIENNIINDANLPRCFGGEKERLYTYSETLHRNKQYLAAINDKDHKFLFSSVELLGVDGRVKLEEYDVKLINRKNDTDDTEKYIDKTMEYCKIVLDHMREYIIY